MTAQSSDAGHLVPCKKCGGDCEVPLEDQEVDRKRDDDPTSSPTSSQKKRRRPEDATSSSSRSKKPPNTKSGKAKRAATASDSGELQLSAPIARADADLMSLDFDQAAVASSAAPIAKDKSKRCQRCGKRLDAKGYCAACKRSERRFEKAEMELDEIPMELAGFQLWFAKIANEGVSIRVLGIVFHVLITLFTVALVMFGLLAIGGFLGVLFTICALAAFALYAALCFKGYQFTRNPHAKLAWFQKPFWNMILTLSRMMKWQAYDSRFKGRTIVDLRNKPITDEKLIRVENFRAAQVLDLQGTLITDEGLSSVYKLKNLYCVVLKNTNVTHAGVTKLQQSIPRLWIWY